MPPLVFVRPPSRTCQCLSNLQSKLCVVTGVCDVRQRLQLGILTPLICWVLLSITLTVRAVFVRCVNPASSISLLRRAREWAHDADLFSRFIRCSISLFLFSCTSP